MVRFLRTASPRTLAVSAIASVALLAGGAVVATGASQDSQRPPAQPLAKALADGVAAAESAAFEGVSARISFSNRLLDSVDTGRGASPLLGSGTGRLWASADGKVRIELQSDAGGGDVELVADGRKAWACMGDGATCFQADMPADRDRPADGKGETKAPPTVASIEKALKAIAGDVKLSDPAPDNIAGRPAYTVTIEPTDTSGLIGGAKVSWDARTGAPLAIAILAKGESDPVLGLSATDVTYGPVDSSVFNIQPTKGAKITKIDTAALAARAKAAGRKQGTKGTAYRRFKPVTGLAAVQAAVGFKIAAPASAGGLERGEVMLIGKGKDAAAAVSYGTGNGAVLVIQRPANKAASTRRGTSEGESSMQLPTRQVGGLTLNELGTPLGSIATFTRDGISFTVIGSAPLARIEAVAAGV